MSDLTQSSAQQALEYIIKRIIESPDVRYNLGPCTEAFERVTGAVAELRGIAKSEVVDAIRARINERAELWERSYRPPERPEVVVLREQVEVLRAALEPHLEDCTACGGARFTEAGDNCLACDGRGRIWPAGYVL